MDELLEQLLADLRGMWLRRFWGIAAGWIVAVVGLLAAFFTPPEYEATARVFVNTESVLKPLMQGIAVQPNTGQQVEMLANTLMSRPNVERLISLANLQAPNEREHNALVERITRSVKLTGSIRDNLFSISYRDKDQARAKRLVESLLSMFVESGLSTKRRDTDKAMAFLDTQIGEYEVVLRQAEQRLKDFKLKNLEQLASGSDAVGNMLAVGNEIEKARTELRAAEQRRDTLRRQLASEQPMFLSSQASKPGAPDALTEIDARADALRRSLDELLRRYTEGHPDVVGTRRILADLEKQREELIEETERAKPDVAFTGTTRREPNLVYQQLKVTLADAEGNVAGLQARLSDLQARYDRIRATAKLKPEFEEELAQLNRDYLIQKTNFEQLVQRREQAKLTGQLDASGSVDFRVIDPPRVSHIPVAPNRLQLIFAVIVLSLAAGVGASFVANRALPTFSATKGLQAVAQRSILGSISYQMTPAVLASRRRDRYTFAGAVAGLCALFGVALTVLLVMTRMG